MVSWKERAKALFQVTAEGETDKTANTPFLSVLSVPSDPEITTDLQIFSALPSQDETPAEDCALFDELMAAAMRCCDAHGDGTKAREDMHEDIATTPPELWSDLLHYFNETYGGAR